MMFFPYILIDMELSVGEIAVRISTTTDAARKRLSRLGYKPVRYIGVNAMFELTEDDLAVIKEHDKRGRPPADTKEKAAPETEGKKKATTKPKKSKK